MTELDSVVLNQVEYKEYVFSKGQDERERLVTQFKCYRPSLVEQFNRVLDEYGLATRLQAANPKHKVKILDLGCGEGLALQTVAEILERRGLLQNADLYGIDADKTAIATAEKFKLQAKPPRPYLHFLVHDATVPLSKCLGLYFEFSTDELVDGEPKFDFIFSSLVFEHIPNARQCLEKIYEQSLKPGGVIFIRDTVLTEGEIGWVLAHQAMRPFVETGLNYMRIANDGVDVSQVTVDWLREFGASQVQAFSTILPIGGESEIGLNMLRNSYLFVRNVGPLLVNKNLVAQEMYDHAMKQLFDELGPHCVGQSGLTDTIAKKPE